MLQSTTQIISTPSSVIPPLQRLLAKTLVSEHGLMWNGGVNNAGYGMLYIRMDGKRRVIVPVHRYWYEQNKGPVPKGFDIHHECHVRRCLTHLTPLPARINRMLQLHDKRFKYA